MEIARVDERGERDARLLVTETDLGKADPRQRHRGEQERGRRQLRRSRADQPAEQAGDGGAEQRQEDDRLVH